MQVLRGEGYVYVLADSIDRKLADVGIADLVSEFNLPVNWVLLIAQNFSNPQYGAKRFGVRRISEGACTMLNEAKFYSELRRLGISQ